MPRPAIFHCVGQGGQPSVLEGDPNTVVVGKGDHIACHWDIDMAAVFPEETFRFDHDQVGADNGGRLDLFAVLHETGFPSTAVQRHAHAPDLRVIQGRFQTASPHLVEQVRLISPRGRGLGPQIDLVQHREGAFHARRSRNEVGEVAKLGGIADLHCCLRTGTRAES